MKQDGSSPEMLLMVIPLGMPAVCVSYVALRALYIYHVTGPC